MAIRPHIQSVEKILQRSSFLCPLLPPDPIPYKGRGEPRIGWARIGFFEVPCLE